jgi:short-subunit dehydrogenase
MIERGSGYILNVSSISAVMPYPTISLYGPTKTYLRYFSRALRYELKPSGIHVSCLLPGAIDTGFYDDTGFDIGKGRKLGIVKMPEFVANSAMKALFRNRAECIPGLLNKLVVRFFPLIPRSWIGLIYRRKLMKQTRITSE